jgi:serine/threonine-protein kinase PknG
MTQASAALTALSLDDLQLHSLSAELLRIAVTQLEANAVTVTSGVQLLGQPVERRALRLGLERELRACAHFAKTVDEKIALIDQANSARPRTLT